MDLLKPQMELEKQNTRGSVRHIARIYRQATFPPHMTSDPQHHSLGSRMSLWCCSSASANPTVTLMLWTGTRPVSLKSLFVVLPVQCSCWLPFLPHAWQSPSLPSCSCQAPSNTVYSDLSWEVLGSFFFSVLILWTWKREGVIPSHRSFEAFFNSTVSSKTFVISMARPECEKGYILEVCWGVLQGIASEVLLQALDQCLDPQNTQKADTVEHACHQDAEIGGPEIPWPHILDKASSGFSERPVLKSRKQWGKSKPHVHL